MKVKEVAVNAKGFANTRYTESDGLTDAFYEPDYDLFIVKFGNNKQMMLPRENVTSFMVETDRRGAMHDDRRRQ